MYISKQNELLNGGWKINETFYDFLEYLSKKVKATKLSSEYSQRQVCNESSNKSLLININGL